MRKWVAVVALLAGCEESHIAGSGPALSPPGDFTPRDLGVTGVTDENPPPPPDLATPANADLAPSPGPWPTAELTTFALGDSILDASPDDAQNLWAASRDTLFLMRAGQPVRKFTAADGLHIGPFTDPSGHSNQTSITALAGGAPNGVFVGYYGYESDSPYSDTEAQRELGNADRVAFDPASGKLSITRYLFRCDYENSSCWENRSPRRMIYVRSGVAGGHLFIGFNHGVSHVFNDTFGDHVHPETWYHYPDGTVTEKIGEYYGLAITPEGHLWMAGRYGVGLQPWNPVPHFKWVDGTFIWAFTIWSGNHAMDVPANYEEDDSGIAVTPDGTVWISSFNRGLVSWQPSTNNYGTLAPVRNPSVPASIQDLAADLDGSLWMIDANKNLLRYTPSTGNVQAWPGISGANRVVIDATVVPRAVWVSTDGGLALIRAK
jgi:hypothetical protein